MQDFFAHFRRVRYTPSRNERACSLRRGAFQRAGAHLGGCAYVHVSWRDTHTLRIWVYVEEVQISHWSWFSPHPGLASLVPHPACGRPIQAQCFREGARVVPCRTIRGGTYTYVYVVQVGSIKALRAG